MQYHVHAQHSEPETDKECDRLRRIKKCIASAHVDMSVKPSGERSEKSAVVEHHRPHHFNVGRKHVLPTVGRVAVKMLIAQSRHGRYVEQPSLRTRNPVVGIASEQIIVGIVESVMEPVVLTVAVSSFTNPVSTVPSE